MLAARTGPTCCCRSFQAEAGETPAEVNIGMSARAVVVAALGTSQTLAWASSYYLPAILADDMARAAGVSRAWVFGAFSGALLLTAALGPWVGRMIDRRGGRGVLSASNIVLATGLVALGASHGIAAQCAAWAVLGLGMALGLYDAAFATLAG